MKPGDKCMDAFEKMEIHLLRNSINIETNRTTGRKYLTVDGVFVGAYDTDKGITIMSQTGAWTVEEILVALTLIASGYEDGATIAEYIVKFRQFKQNKLK